MRKFSYWGEVLYVEFGERLLRGFNPNLTSVDECERRIHEVIAESGVSPVILPYDWAVLGGEVRVGDESGSQFFTDLCNVVIFLFVDVAHKAGNLQSKSCRRLIEAGYTRNGRVLDSDRVYEVYEQIVLSYGRQILGPTWTRERDYWGAVCLHDGPRPTGDKNPDHVLAGDSVGHVMFFTGLQALKEYMHERSREHRIAQAESVY